MIEERRRASEPTSFRIGVQKTGDNRVLHFSAPPDSFDSVREAISHMYRAYFAENHRTSVEHGGYGRYSRYDLQQHKYAGGEGGFTEVLEIKDGPEGRAGNVVHQYVIGRGGKFWEFESVEAATGAFEDYFRGFSSTDKLDTLPGFVRKVECGPLAPWFYAVGTEELIGDYALPKGLNDDPVFRLGAKFAVTDYYGNIAFKTCVGSRYVETEPRDWTWPSGERGVKRYTEVYFDDGSTWKEGSGTKIVRPVKQDELWAIEALAQFQEILAGSRQAINLESTDGTKIRVKIEQGKSAYWQTVGGEYVAEVFFTDGTSTEGRFEFAPTKEFPSASGYIVKRLDRGGKKIAKIKLFRENHSKPGKKFSGEFYPRDTISTS